VARIFEKQPAVWGEVKKEDTRRVRVDDRVSLDSLGYGGWERRERQLQETGPAKNSSSIPSQPPSRKRKRSRILPRALDRRVSGRTWELSQISLPPETDWGLPTSPGESTDYRIWNDDESASEEYIAYWDDSYGEGQLIYICEQGVLASHNVRSPASASLRCYERCD
jgi:hypothetical protein